MQQSEILSLTEKLIPVYRSDDFEFVLNQLTEGEPASLKLLVKMELNKLMAPCQKSIDLRGRVQGEVREYVLDGKTHWFDDVALNAYHKNVQKYGSFTEGVWQILTNTRNNFRVMHQKNKQSQVQGQKVDPAFVAEPIRLGFHLQRQENRLKVASQVEITLDNQTNIHGVSVDLSSSGAKFKLPSAFQYQLGDVISVSFTELRQSTNIPGLSKPIEYRILGVDDFSESVRIIRTLKLTETEVIDQAIEKSLQSETKRSQHDNQDKIIRTRTKGYEHAYLKHTCHLPLFFSGKDLKLAMLTDNNQPLWQYWQDERNQQTIANLFSPNRMEYLTRPGMRNSSNMIYAFNHQHKERQFFYSMMLPEASIEQRQLFWHLGSRQDSWKAFRIQIFELSESESQALAENTEALRSINEPLTHCGILQEISSKDSASDYLLTERPRLPSSEINPFRHARKIVSQPLCMYFDDKSRRREPRYQFTSPLTVTTTEGKVFNGNTIDLSKHGLSLKLDEPGIFKADDQIKIHFKELQRYDSSVPLSKVPYRVIRTNNHTLQLAILSSGDTVKTTVFLNKLIEHNQEKLKSKKEILPSPELLQSLHACLLDKMVSSPFFVHKDNKVLSTNVIGVNYPLPEYLKVLSQYSGSQGISLEPLFKGKTNSLLATPMKRIVGAEPSFNELYVAVVKSGERIDSIHTRLRQEFKSINERIMFIKKARMLGECFVLRLSGAPVFDSFTKILQQDLLDLTQLNMISARNVEKEIANIIGYGEITDITEEVLIRLELT
ncbi:PilZ domain-containing protein [Vibrio maerlii]|uniref:PilZ domain-containing protein n=1 Tax=Vibrio maerlii TaxID=2231648 RepID=UPI000E3C6CF7|nr:PilZ domain-containing protein [Vibrio maerlii]